ncbi:MAG TPA: TIGR00645 family protein [Candidatus Tenderia sp.]|nr:TIGR00645 family protein [Candidatus Tenderia sp.]
MKKLEHFLEAMIFGSRWLLVPFYIGLVFSIGILLLKFGKEFLHLMSIVMTAPGTDIIVGILTLVDVVLLANLLLIIIFAGYENFVSKIDTADHEDRPSWMGKVGFTDLKIKLIGSIVAISGIELLKTFVNVKDYSNDELAWTEGIHLTFVFSGVMFALMDWMGTKSKEK